MFVGTQNNKVSYTDPTPDKDNSLPTRCVFWPSLIGSVGTHLRTKSQAIKLRNKESPPHVQNIVIRRKQNGHLELLSKQKTVLAEHAFFKKKVNSKNIIGPLIAKHYLFIGLTYSPPFSAQQGSFGVA